MRDYAFGNRITSLRTELGFSQFQLGKLLGVSDKAVSKWENGNAKPRMATCYRLADVLGVSLDELLSSGNSEDTRQKEREAVSMQRDEVQTVKRRQDAAEDKRIELHVRTGMSRTDGVAMEDAYIQRAAEWGHTAIAIADYGVTKALPRAFKAAKRRNIKLLPGCEGFMLPEENSPIESGYPIMLLAMNRQGITNLNRLMTMSHMQGRSNIPCMTRAEVQACRDGLLIGSSCDGGDVIRAIRAGAVEAEIRQMISFYDYLEIQPVENEADDPEKQAELQQAIETVVRLGEGVGIPVAAVSNARYLDPEDAISRAVLRYNIGILEQEAQPLYYYRTTEEMLEAFRFLGEESAREVVIRAPKQIADRVEDGLTLFPGDQKKYHPVLPGMQENVTGTAQQKARELYGDPLPGPVAERLQEELAVIAQQDSWVNFEIARRAMDYVHQEGYSAGSRGTVGASLVAYLCGITDIDPLMPHYRCPQCCRVDFDVDHTRYRTGLDLPLKRCPDCGCAMQGTGFGIPMESFFGAHGEREADINLNIAGDLQKRVLEKVSDMFGRDHALIPSCNMGPGFRKTGKYVRQYLADHHLQMKDSEVQRITDNVSHMHDRTGKHPGGLIIIPADRDVNEFTPIQYLTDDWLGPCVITHYDAFDLMDRLLKVDLLGWDAPRLLYKMCRETGIDLADVPLNDARALSLFRSPEAMNVTARETLCGTGSCNINGVSSVQMQKVLKELQPQSVEELIRIHGFVHGTNVWEGNGQEYARAGVIRWTECPAHREDIFMDLTRCGLSKEDAYTREFGIGRFDLIIIDEAHRSIFKKYGALFNYFDALMIGLTATPRCEENKSTYETFKLEDGKPDFAYELEEAIRDKYLVGFSVQDKTTDKMRRGICYDDLTEEEKESWEDGFADADEEGIDFTGAEIEGQHIGKNVINIGTIDAMLNDLMQNGLKIDGGDTLGKTIIFAANHIQAVKIVERFQHIYPTLGMDFCKLIDSHVENNLTLIEQFEVRGGMPQIAVSVDMMDTGIDVPDVVNLVFFKQVRSKIKFLQMIGRGTRLSPGLFGPGLDKQGFLIFDYYDNFRYFSTTGTWSTVEGSGSSQQITPQTVTMNKHRLGILMNLQQESALCAFDLAYRDELKAHFISETRGLNNDDITVQYHMAYVNKYRTAEMWDNLDERREADITEHILPLFPSEKAPVKVKSFDTLIYLLEKEVPRLEKQGKDIRKIRNGFKSVAAELTYRMEALLKLKTIPAIVAQTELISAMIDGDYLFEHFSLERAETVRKTLRDLMAYLPNEKNYVIINVRDWVEDKENIDPKDNEQPYPQRVQVFLNSSNLPSLAKLRNLDPLTAEEKKELEGVFMSKLGTPAEFTAWSNGMALLPFLRLQIGIADEAIATKFGSFLNNQTLNPMQMSYCQQILDYARKNGDITMTVLLKESPFCDMDVTQIFGASIAYIKQLINGLHKPVM